MSAKESSRVFLAHGRDVSHMSALARVLEAQGLAVIDPVSELDAPLQKSVENSLSSADIVVADLTGSNPNVLYELGLARALNIPTILIMDRKAEGALPTDLAGSQIIFYDDADLSAMETRVTKAVERLVA
jgi:nucleoside 2-deoxyribosyltransferase